MAVTAERVEMEVGLADEAATSALGARLAAAIDTGLVIHLHGELGTGKTTLARALLRTLGAGERIKSPTYSLVEPYVLADGRPAWHLDLYRIAAAAELEWLGLDALAERQAVVLVEWPERGAGALPAADLQVRLEHAGSGRQAALSAASARGRAVLAHLSR
jgi:tRNA threonylcarbamoyladenosine biosynthesis protein TsaE